MAQASMLLALSLGKGQMLVEVAGSRRRQELDQLH